MDLSRFNITGKKDKAETIRRQNSRLIRIRWYYIGILTGVATVSSLTAGLPTKIAQQYIVICLIAFGINLLILLVNRIKRFGEKSLYGLMILQLMLDLGVASYVTYQQGGIEARTPILFALPILAAGLIYINRMVYIIAFTAGLGYLASVFAEKYFHDGRLFLTEDFVPLIFYPVFFMLLAKLTVYLMTLNNSETRDQAYDAFLALLTHQLIHPASTANAIIDQLEHTPVNSHTEIRRYIALLKAENKNLLQLINNLLESSTEAKITNEEEIELNSLLKLVGDKTSQTYGRHADLHLDLGKKQINIWGNKQKIVTVLVNILNNAFQYTKKGTSVKMTLRKSGSEALIVVEDQGEGIDDKVMKQLFRKYNVNREGDNGILGLGLGLYVSKKIVLAHRGSIHLFSDNNGTRVMIKLKRGRHHE